MRLGRFFIVLGFFAYWISSVQAQSIEKNNRTALIIGIAEYDSPDAPPLPGVPADIISAKKIALAMGVPEKNITFLRNQDATKVNIMNAFQDFSEQAADGGRAFIYYSGHGTRGYDPVLKNCYEGLLSYDRQVITHDEIAVATKKLNDQVDKSIVMFDACHSGGVIKTGFQTRGGVSKLTPKFYSKASSSELDTCALPSNFKTRGLFEKSSRLGALQENLVFISAARPDEVSYDEGVNKGGVATQAIRDCLLGSASDMDSSGSVSLAEIQSCSQDIVNTKLPGPIYLPSHITLRGNRNLIPVAASPAQVALPTPLATPASTTMSPPVIETVTTTNSTKPTELVQNISNQANTTELVKPIAVVPTPMPLVPPKPIESVQAISPVTTSVPSSKPVELVQNNISQNVKPEPIKPILNQTEPAKPVAQISNPVVETPLASIATLKDIEAQRNPTRKLDIQLGKKTLKINKDYLELKIKSSHTGYLYLVLLGSDNNSFYVLYPNKLDGNNRIEANKQINLPNPSWQIKVAGPVGTDYILAIVSDSPRDLNALGALGRDPNSPYTYTLNNLQGRSSLINYLTGKGSEGSSEKFSAQILSVQEVQ